VCGSDVENLPLQTFEEIVQSNREWWESGAKQSRLKDIFKCRNVPLSIIPTEERVIDFILRRELHLFLSIVNKLFFEL